MENYQGKESCTFKEKSFSHGSIVCDDSKCMECDDGEWKVRLETHSARKGLDIGPGKDLSDL